MTLKPILLAALFTSYSPNTFAATANDMPQSHIATKDETTEMNARGVLRAKETADIAAGMSGRLTAAPLKSGQYFKRGALLAKFDCRAQEAELDALTRAHATLTLKHENTQELLSLGAAGQLDADIARSEMLQAAAERGAVKARLKDCVVYAPYSGFIAERHVSAFETPQAGQPLYSIIRAGRLEISVIAPSAWMRWIKRGTSFSFQVDETGDQFIAKIDRMGAAVDPVSQTIELTATPTGKTGRSLAGMSGVALFTPQSVEYNE